MQSLERQRKWRNPGTEVQQEMAGKSRPVLLYQVSTVLQSLLRSAGDAGCLGPGFAHTSHTAL